MELEINYDALAKRHEEIWLEEMAKSGIDITGSYSVPASVYAEVRGKAFAFDAMQKEAKEKDADVSIYLLPHGTCDSSH